MTRIPSTFRQADLTKALRAAAAAGVDIARVEIDTTGKIVIVTGKPTGASETVDELDRELAEWEVGHGKG
jgi:hypothetical protein